MKISIDPLQRKPKKALYMNKLGQVTAVMSYGHAGEDWPKNVYQVQFPAGDYANVFRDQLKFI